MTAFLQSVLLLLAVLVSATSSASVQTQGTLLCSVRNRDPCLNFPDLCTTGGARCRVKGPCEYECVCLTESKECTGTQLVAPARTNVQQVESESLLYLSPDLFQDPTPAPKVPVPVPVNSTVAPTTETTTPTTTSTTTKSTTSSTTSTSTIVSLAAMIERQTVMAKALQDAMKASAQQLENKTTKGIQQNDSSEIVTNASSSPQATQKVSGADDSSSSPKQEIKQIFENIKSSFQLLATHILGDENRSTSTTEAPPAVSKILDSSETPTSSALLSSSTIIPTSSSSQTELNTA